MAEYRAGPEGLKMSVQLSDPQVLHHSANTCPFLSRFWHLPDNIACRVFQGAVDPETLYINTQNEKPLEAAVSFELESGLKPAWWDPDEQIHIFVPAISATPIPGDPLAYFCVDGKKIPAIVKQGTSIIFNFDPEITYRAFELGMAQEELDRTDVSGLAIN